MSVRVSQDRMIRQWLKVLSEQAFARAQVTVCFE